MITITIGKKQYKVKEAKTPEEKQKGLQGTEKLPEDEGMLFYFDPPQDVSFWMKDVAYPLDIIFIDDDQEVEQISEGEPNSEKQISAKQVAYVLEINKGSGIQIGDELELEEDSEPVMKVLFPDGSEQMALWGGERIFSRTNTKVLIRKAKKAANTLEDADYKALGKYMFKCIKVQDERKPEYVDAPTKDKE